MEKYLALLDDVLTNGKKRTDPQGVGNYSVFGRQVHYNLTEGFPLVTTRSLKGSWKAAKAELLWILAGNTNAQDLHQYGVHLWDQWATPETSGKLGYENGELGPIYGHQLRNFNGRVDQLSEVVGMLRRRPDTRRSAISFWNLEDIEINGEEKVFIAPCIAWLHFYHQDNNLSLHVVQRSADLPVGVPFDVAEYSLFLMLMARELNMVPNTLVHTLSDAHIYHNQVEGVKELLRRKPRQMPTVTIDQSFPSVLFDRLPERPLLDLIRLENYDPHPAISIPVAT